MTESESDREVLKRALAGVKPLKGKSSASNPKSVDKPRAATDRVADEEARARLDRLVGGGVCFKVERPDSFSIVGYREGTHRSHVESLEDAPLRRDDALDLHGLRQGAAKRAVVKYVREQHKLGLRYVLIVHGKGRHSEGGQGVLQGATIEALSKGGAAPYVMAFATASRKHGGEGALVVKLVDRVK